MILQVEKNKHVEDFTPFLILDLDVPDSRKVHLYEFGRISHSFGKFVNFDKNIQTHHAQNPSLTAPRDVGIVEIPKERHLAMSRSPEFR